MEWPSFRLSKVITTCRKQAIVISVCIHLAVWPFVTCAAISPDRRIVTNFVPAIGPSFPVPDEYKSPAAAL
jgi:hypothetical protein